MHPKDIIAQLRARREHLGLSRRALSLLLGYSSETVRHWEDGQNNPSFPALLMWAKSLGMELILERGDE